MLFVRSPHLHAGHRHDPARGPPMTDPSTTKPGRCSKRPGSTAPRPGSPSCRCSWRRPAPCGRTRSPSTWQSRTLNKVTVYRTLESLIEVGLVHRAFMHKRAWYFELADHCTEQQCHPHFTCTHCGVTHCLTDILLPMAKIPRKGVHRQPPAGAAGGSVPGLRVSICGSVDLRSSIYPESHGLRHVAPAETTRSFLFRRPNRSTNI